ncbi:HD-GYP domain-containing protein [Pseudomonas sp. LPB0260]|uniref:HD-GYP domain-containing protein n=1 Tax=Pseudomonas sp. LPB0260 TaxID=2614442 RepID=UPI0015C293AE|nr:HD-GYP domain-containing protein [Pseudomonas sp. LPB0260]QLC72707.1 HD-GYP domain-containing protein [Pseudomonas sp. LPB0260]QLC75481.1 HD-GYP domain-containing protein [Pseudomonas sp. LPB0260]
MLKRISVTELLQGMYIHELCGSWMEHPFWKTRFLLNSGKDLQRILESGIREVWIDTSKGLDLPSGLTVEQVEEETEAVLLAAAPVAPVEAVVPVTPVAREVRRHSLEEEVERAARLCDSSKRAVMEMFGDARMGQAIEVGQARELVEQISASIMRQPNALISLARLKHADEYTYMHSVAVCALMIALARQLGLAEEQVREAGMAGLLHDIGKMRMPLEVLNKPGKLSDSEFATMRGHPEAGARLLIDCKQVSALVLDVCLHHHEKVDGTGYPHRLVGEQISLFARMGAVCDVYDAITSNRPYKAGWEPAQSIHKMAEWSKGHFDERVFQAFVKTVGIYPTGSLVRLQSGRLGVVLEQHGQSLLTPRVKVFFSTKSRQPIAQEIVDLSKLNGHERIVGRESPSEWGLSNLDELWTGLPSRESVALS